MSAELAEIRMELSRVRRELAVAMRQVKLIRPHLYADDSGAAVSSGGDGAIVTISSTAGGSAGTYGGTAFDLVTGLSAAATIVNEPEVALNPAHKLLKTGESYVGLVDPSSGNAFISPLPVGETATPNTLGSNTEGSETADSTTWSRTSDAKPLDVWITCRVVYNDAGDHKLYEYRRKFSYDACGLLIAVSAEARIEVDAPGSCP
jgi:hypothetical protein